MSKTLKPPAIIAIIAIAIAILLLIGYKSVGPVNSPDRTDAAHRDIVASMAAARASSHKGGAPGHPYTAPAHP